MIINSQPLKDDEIPGYLKAIKGGRFKLGGKNEVNLYTIGRYIAKDVTSRIKFQIYAIIDYNLPLSDEKQNISDIFRYGSVGNTNSIRDQILSVINKECGGEQKKKEIDSILRGKEIIGAGMTDFFDFIPTCPLGHLKTKLIDYGIIELDGGWEKFEIFLKNKGCPNCYLRLEEEIGQGEKLSYIIDILLYEYKLIDNLELYNKIMTDILGFPVQGHPTYAIHIYK